MKLNERFCHRAYTILARAERQYGVVTLCSLPQGRPKGAVPDSTVILYCKRLRHVYVSLLERGRHEEASEVMRATVRLLKQWRSGSIPNS